MNTNVEENTEHAEKQKTEAVLIDRETLCQRWRCSRMMIQRMQKAGRLKAVMLGTRIVRYRLKDILAIEQVEA